MNDSSPVLPPLVGVMRYVRDMKKSAAFAKDIPAVSALMPALKT